MNENISCHINKQKCQSIQRFRLPNMNEGSQDCDQTDAATLHGDCWWAGGRQEAAICHSLSWTRKQDLGPSWNVKLSGPQEASLQTKLVEVMEFQLSYFKSWKLMLLKCCTQYASKFGKLSSGHRIGKGQFSFQSQRKAMPKNAQTSAQLHSSHMLVK